MTKFPAGGRWVCVLGCLVDISEGEFLTRDGHQQCLTLPRLNTRLKLWRALCLLSENFTSALLYYPENLAKSKPFLGSCM